MEVVQNWQINWVSPKQLLASIISYQNNQSMITTPKNSQSNICMMWVISRLGICHVAAGNLNIPIFSTYLYRCKVYDIFGRLFECDRIYFRICFSLSIYLAGCLARGDRIYVIDQDMFQIIFHSLDIFGWLFGAGVTEYMWLNKIYVSEYISFSRYIWPDVWHGDDSYMATIWSHPSMLSTLCWFQTYHLHIILMIYVLIYFFYWYICRYILDIFVCLLYCNHLVPFFSSVC